MNRIAICVLVVLAFGCRNSANPVEDVLDHYKVYATGGAHSAIDEPEQGVRISRCFVSVLFSSPDNVASSTMARIEIYPPCEGVDASPFGDENDEALPCHRYTLADGRTITICDKGAEWEG